MPENIKQLRRRIRSVTSTRKITRTMEMISVAKLRRVQQAMESARPYAAKIQQLAQDLARSEAAAAQPLFEQREDQRVSVVVVASDRGLCGGYNNAVLRKAEDFIRKLRESSIQTDVFTVGKRARDYARKRQWETIDSIIDLGGNIDVSVSNQVAETMTARFLEGETDRVVLAYNSFVSASSYDPVITQFLPLEAGELEHEDANKEYANSHEIDYIFEPSAKAVFDELLPRYVKTKIHAALLEAMTTEHIARRIAMNNATENAGEMIDALTLRANKARQAAITTEITEIVGGAEALKG